MTIGATAQPTAVATAEMTETLPIAELLIRWFNLIALVWAVGSIAFVVLVWHAVGLDGQVDIERRLRQVMWVGWVSMGVAALLILLFQAAAPNGEVGAALSTPVLVELVTRTRFGTLWLARGALWIVHRNLDCGQPAGGWLLWSALIAGAVVLRLTSLFSHSGASAGSSAADAGGLVSPVDDSCLAWRTGAVAGRPGRAWRTRPSACELPAMRSIVSSASFRVWRGSHGWHPRHRVLRGMATGRILERSIQHPCTAGCSFSNSCLDCTIIGDRAVNLVVTQRCGPATWYGPVGCVVGGAGWGWRWACCSPWGA